MKNPRILGTALALGLAAGPACHKGEKTKQPGYYGEAATVLANARDLLHCVDNGPSDQGQWGAVQYHPQGQDIVSEKTFTNEGVGMVDTVTAYHRQDRERDLTVRTAARNANGALVQSNYYDENADGTVDGVFSLQNGEREEPTERDQAVYETALRRNAGNCREAINALPANQSLPRPAVSAPPTKASVPTVNASPATTPDTSSSALDLQINQLETMLVDTLSRKNKAGHDNFNFEHNFDSSRWGKVTIEYSETLNNGQKARHLKIRPKGISKDQQPAFYTEAIAEIASI